ncbi:MAG: hypothetical protein ACXAC2_00240 [Candidatus Kariarchaeaceae archaeon]
MDKKNSFIKDNWSSALVVRLSKIKESNIKDFNFINENIDIMLNAIKLSYIVMNTNQELGLSDKFDDTLIFRFSRILDSNSHNWLKSFCKYHRDIVYYKKECNTCKNELYLVRTNENSSFCSYCLLAFKKERNIEKLDNTVISQFAKNDPLNYSEIKSKTVFYSIKRYNFETTVKIGNQEYSMKQFYSDIIKANKTENWSIIPRYSEEMKQVQEQIKEKEVQQSNKCHYCDNLGAFEDNIEENGSIISVKLCYDCANN